MENKIELPDIDSMITIGKKNPEELLKLKDKLVNKIIERQKTNEQKEKLKKLQDYINMLEESSSNKIHFCVKLSNLMHSKLKELDYILKEGTLVPNEIKENNILIFKPK